MAGRALVFTCAALLTSAACSVDDPTAPSTSRPEEKAIAASDTPPRTTPVDPLPASPPAPTHHAEQPPVVEPAGAAPIPDSDGAGSAVSAGARPDHDPIALQPVGDEPAAAQPVDPAPAEPAPAATATAAAALGGAGSGTIGLGRPGIPGRGAPLSTRGSGRRTLGPVPGALGLSPTIQLYTFRADPERGLAAHPRQCRPEYILETIVAVVNRAAGPCEAQRNRIPQAAVDMAYVMCRAPEGVPGCERTYVGTLWVERTPGTHHDYDLQAFGRVARTCGTRVEAVTGASDRRFTRRGEALGRLFDLCGQRLTGEASSTSESTRPDGWPR